MALNTIYNGIGSKVFEQVKDVEKASEVWTRLEETYEGTTMVMLTPFLDTYPGSVECRSAKRGNSNWSAGELPMRVVADKETAECG